MSGSGCAGGWSRGAFALAGGPVTAHQHGNTMCVVCATRPGLGSTIILRHVIKISPCRIRISVSVGPSGVRFVHL